MSKEFIQQLKVKNICSFYIDNINDKFFTSLKNHPSKKFINKILPKIQKNLNEIEMNKFYEIDNLTKVEKIKLMLNHSLKKIVSKTGNSDGDFFAVQEIDKFNEPLYIKEIMNYGDIQLVGDEYDDRRYNFSIEINPNIYLYKYIEEIQLSFFLDEDNKILSGGFSWNHKQIPKKIINFDEAIDKVYIDTLIKYFVNKQLYPMTLNNILDIVEHYEMNSNQKKKFSKQPNAIPNNKKPLDFKNVGVSDLRENWINLINKKYLSFKKMSKEEINYFENELFFSILIVSIISLGIYEELKKYFTNDNPEIILNLLNKPSLIKEDPNQSPETDFIELVKHLRITYFNEYGKKNKLNKIKTADDFFEAINTHSYFENYSFGKPIQSFEILRIDNTPLMSEVHLFDNDEELKIIYLLIIHPELFALDENTANFIDLEQLKNILSRNKITSKLSESLKTRIEDSKCEFNYNYISFLSDTSTILLIKNDTFLFDTKNNLHNKKSNLYANYFWAEIYCQSRNWMRMDIEYEFSNKSIIKNSRYYRENIIILENLKFSIYDDFYGMSQIKNIVRKIDKLDNIQKSIDQLISQMRKTDQASKKDRERKSILLAYVVATLIGFINFFAMVFTILTVENIKAGLKTENITVISIASLLATILLSILIYFLTREIKNWKFKKRKF